MAHLHGIDEKTRTRRWTVAPSVSGLVVAVAALVSGCAVTEGEGVADPAPVVSATQGSTSPDITGASSPGAEPHDADASAAPGALTETMTLSASAVTAFCRPALDYETWIGELYPFLSQAAGAAYETVDPANVPCTSMTGESVVRDGDDPYTVGISVPTDAGEYTVYLHRTGADAPWAVEQITPASAG